MTAVARAAALLKGLRDTDQIGELCRRHDVDLLVLFGSAIDRPQEARDVDVAARFGTYEARRVLPLLDELMQLLKTSAVDLMVLNRAGAVAREQALVYGEPIWAARGSDHAEAQIAATLERLDGAWARRLELEGLTG